MYERTSRCAKASGFCAAAISDKLVGEMARQGIYRGWLRALLSLLIVLGGVATAFLTVWARRAGDWEFARIGALLSLVFVLLMLFVVVPPLARSARLEAARINLPFQLTGGGLVFLCALAVVAFAAWNTRNNLLFLIFSVMLSALFVAGAAGRVTLRDLVVSARFPDHIFAGEPAPVFVSVQNVKRFLPSFSVLVEARSRSASPRAERRGFKRFRRTKFERRALAYFVYAPRSAKVEQKAEQTFERRGRVVVTGFEISTRFPFGLFRLRRRLRVRDVEIIVYPRPRPSGDELHLLPMNAGRLTAERRGAGQELHSLRDYQPRDDVRHIDWKATARADRLIVREFAAEDERRVHVALDTHVELENGAGGSGKSARIEVTKDAGDRNAKAESTEAAQRFERGVDLAASLLSHFAEERAEVCLTLGSERGDYGAGREHLYALLRRLALAELSASRASESGRAEFWEQFRIRSPASEDNYVIILTTAAHGSIPAHVWRTSHVVYF